MGIFVKLTEDEINYVCNGGNTLTNGYQDFVTFHELIGSISYEDAPKALKILKTVSRVQLNCIDDVTRRSILDYIDNLEILEYVIPYLLDNTITALDSDNKSILFNTIDEGNREKAEFLVKNLPDSAIKELLEYPGCLHYAIEKDMGYLCELIINKVPKSLMRSGGYNETALHVAIRNDCTDIAKFIINKLPSEGFNLTNCYNETPLHLAITKHNVEICKLLIPKMSLEGLELYPDYSKRNLYRHAEIEYLLEIRDLIEWKIKKLKYPDNA
jgi:hypothetical protein